MFILLFEVIRSALLYRELDTNLLYANSFMIRSHRIFSIHWIVLIRMLLHFNIAWDACT